MSQETDPLLTPLPSIPIQSRKQTRYSLITTHLATPISPQKTPYLLIFCYMITGLLDSSAITTWGSFVSMQTGNTVYLGLGLAQALSGQGNYSHNYNGGDDGKNNQRWLKSLLSIASFCVGSCFFGLLHYRAFRCPRARGALVASFLVQMGCLGIAAGVVTARLVSFGGGQGIGGEELDYRVAVPLALVAFQSAGQAVLSRVVGTRGLTSVVLTSVYCDLFLGLAVPGERHGVEEWRRVGAILGLLVGTLMGGLWARVLREAGLAGALWMAVVLKGGIVVAWLVWRGEDLDADGGGDGDE
ncbi:hypothetical protein BJX61DRAFT_494430 [Aspergillus egyptiacus]|nr:hypothetical protein BJX61DRAFT_494430 [Aspergillus egyptiacus]